MASSGVAWRPGLLAGNSFGSDAIDNKRNPYFGAFGLVRKNGVVCGNDGEGFRENRIREKRDRAVVIEAEEAMEVFCERERVFTLWEK